MNKRLKQVITIIIICLLIVFLILRRTGVLQNNKSNNPASASQSNILQVTGEIISESVLSNRILTSGSVIPDEEVELTSETSGRIVKIYFREGRAVNEGTLLVKINDADLQAQLDRLKYQEKLSIEKEFRQRSLLEREAISTEEYEQALTELNVIRADINLVKAGIRETEIRAPFDGIIGLRYVSEGAFISPNTRVARLVRVKPLKIDFSVPEKYANQVEAGNELTFRVEGINQSMKARVIAVEPRVDPQTRTLNVRASYANPDGRIFPGVHASIEFVLGTINNAIQIPTQALIPELGGQKVFLYREGTAFPVDVETGIRTSDHIQITNGIQAGDTIITSGLLQIRQGMKVDLNLQN